MGPNYGLYQSAYGVGGVVLPMLMATILGLGPTPATYIQGFYAAAVLIVIAIVLSLMIRPPSHPEAPAKSK